MFFTCRPIVRVCEFFLIFSTIAAPSLWAQEILNTGNDLNTRVDLDASISQYWRNDRHFKLFKCWGGPTEIEVWEDEYKKSFQSDSGSINDSLGKATKAGFEKYSPQQVHWDAKFNADRVFQLEFSQDVADPKVNYIRHKCSTQKFYTQVDTISNSLVSNASFVVPPGVSLLRVHRTHFEQETKTAHNLESKISQVYPIEPTAEAKPQTISVGEYNYFFVQPGDRIDFNVSWNSQAIEDARFKVEYEMRLLGSEKCEKVLWNPSERLKPETLKNIGHRLTVENFQKNPHETIETMACLYNKTYIESLFSYSHGSDIVDFLKLVDSRIKALESRDDADPFYSVMWTVAQISLYKMSTDLLSDLKPYCERKDVIDFMGLEGSTIKISGFHYIAREFKRISYLFEVAPVSPLRTLVSVLNQFKNEKRSYQEAANPESLRSLEEFEYAVFERPFRIFNIVQDLMLKLPSTQAGRVDREHLLVKLDEGVELTRKMEAQFKTLAQKFSKKSPEAIDPAEFEASINAYEDLIQLTLKLLKKDFQWFALEGEGNVHSTPFSEQMSDVNLGILQISEGLLSATHKAVLTRIGILNTEQAQTLTEYFRSCGGERQ